MASEPGGWSSGGVDRVPPPGDRGTARAIADRRAALLPTAEERAFARRRVRRFGATERWLHAVNGVAFLILLGTGLALFLPFLAQVFGNRPVVKAIHLAVAALWLTAIVLTPILGDRRAIRRTRRQFESLDAEDLRWLRSHAVRDAPQGRFNGGQKLHAVVQGALTVLFFVSGTLLYLGERNTSFRLPGTIALHDVAMLVGMVFVIGHVYIAFSPAARASLSGMVDGTVPASYAKEHHARWNPDDEPVDQLPRIGWLRGGAAFLVLVAGLLGAALLAGA